MTGINSACWLPNVSSDGNISALESKGRQIYIGTDQGTISKWAVSTPSSRQVTASKEGFVVLEKKRVTQLIHDSVWPRMIALCGELVYFIDTDRMSVICSVPETKGTNCVALSPLYIDKQGAELHRFVVSLPRKRFLLIFSYTMSAVQQIQQLVIPSQALCLSFFEDSICCGHVKEYSLLNVQDGSVTGLLQLNNQHPLSMLMDSDVLLRLNEIVFVVNMKQANASLSPSTLRGGAAGGGGSQVSVKYNIRFETEPLAFGFQHPYVVAFQKNHVDVYSIYERELIQRLPLSECALATSVTSHDLLVAASRNKVCVMQLHPLDDHLWALVKQGRIDDATDLLHYHQFEDQQQMEVQLNIMAGIAFLQNNKPELCTMHCSYHIDVRELLLHLPELKPIRDESDTDDVFWSGWVPNCKYNTPDVTLTQRWTEIYAGLPRDGTSLEKYLSTSFEKLENELIIYLKARREGDDVVQRRCADYALLVLYVNHKQYKNLYQLLSSPNECNVRDVERWLTSKSEFRCLALIYYKKGHIDKCIRLMTESLSLRKRLAEWKTSVLKRSSRVKNPKAAELSVSNIQQDPARDVCDVLLAVDWFSASYLLSILDEQPLCVAHQDSEGNTPLHHAVFGALTNTNMIPVLTLLVDRGASINTFNNDGISPLDIAWECDRSLKLYGLLLATAGVRDRSNNLASERAKAFLQENPMKDWHDLTAVAMGKSSIPYAGSWCGRFIHSHVKSPRTHVDPTDI